MHFVLSYDLGATGERRTQIENEIHAIIAPYRNVKCLTTFYVIHVSNHSEWELMRQQLSNYSTRISEKLNFIMTPLMDGGMYNVGRGVPVSLREQIEGIVKVFSPKNNPSVIIPRPDKPDAREYVNDISKTQKDLGYKPEYDYYNLLIDYKKYMENEPMKLLWGTKEDYD